MNVTITSYDKNLEPSHGMFCSNKQDENLITEIVEQTKEYNTKERKDISYLYFAFLSEQEKLTPIKRDLVLYFEDGEPKLSQGLPNKFWNTPELFPKMTNELGEKIMNLFYNSDIYSTTFVKSS